MWRLKWEGEKVRKGEKKTDEDKVASFDNHMRLFQQRRDLSGGGGGDVKNGRGCHACG